MKNENKNQTLATIQETSEDRLRELHADMLDETYPPFKCCGVEYAASATLRLVDEVSYILSFNEFISRNWIEHPFKGGYYIPKQN